jgi:Kef-type K+ transport system membrane component KefB
MALACAAVDDVTAWCLLAFVVGFVDADTSRAAITFALSVGYITLMLAVVRPVLEKRLLPSADGSVSLTAQAMVIVGILMSSLTTELIGIHAIFGAFLLGLTIPARARLAEVVTNRIEGLVVVLLLPCFFVYTGSRVQLGLLQSTGEWFVCALIVITACAGKFGGTALAARFVGQDWRSSAILGILMNTRGLVELVVLNIGLDLGVLSPTLFAMFVVMAVVTTAGTSPVLSRLSQRTRAAQRGEPSSESFTDSVVRSGLEQSP